MAATLVRCHKEKTRNTYVFQQSKWELSKAAAWSRSHECLCLRLHRLCLEKYCAFMILIT